MQTQSMQTTSHKRWMRPRNILLAIVVSLGLVIISLVVWAYTVTPTISTNYAERMLELTAQAQPEGDNAWPYLEQACAILTKTQQAYDPLTNAAQTVSLDPMAPITPDASDAEVELANAYLDALAQSEVYDLLDKVMRCPRMVRPIDTGDTDVLIGILLPHLSPSRSLAKANTVRMVLGLEQGDIDTAVTAFEQNLSLARHHCHQTTLIEHLVGYAIASLTLDHFGTALDDADLDADAMRRFADALDRQGPVPSIELALRGEQMFMLDMVQRTFSDDGRGSGRFLLAYVESDPLGMGTGPGPIGPDVAPGPRILNLGGLVFASRADHVREIDFMIDEAIRLLHLPAGERAIDPFNINLHLNQLGWRYRMLHVLVPAVSRSFSVFDTIRLKWDGLRLRLAIEGYHAATGEYPDSLDALVPEWIDALPSDPYTGGELVYQRMDDAHGNDDYRLLSYGIDGEDDTMITGEEDPDAFVDDDEVGDHVIHAPAPPLLDADDASPASQ
jgi:hypothetical protein